MVLLMPASEQEAVKPKEGELFKVITAYGKTFEIVYGFYDDRERHNGFAEPVPIYPDFEKAPQFAEDGKPFVTAMQNPCESFDGEKDDNSACGDCSHYRHCDELIGTCDALINKKTEKTKIPTLEENI